MVGDFMTYHGGKTNNTPQFLKYLPSTRPISNNTHIGIANNTIISKSISLEELTKKANNIIDGTKYVKFFYSYKIRFN